MQAGALFTVLGYVYAGDTPLHLFFVLCVLTVMFARVYFGMHFIGDTVVGATVGWFYGASLWLPLLHLATVSTSAIGR